MLLKLLVLLNLFVSVNAMSEMGTLKLLGFQAPSQKTRSTIDRQLIERAGYYVLKHSLMQLTNKANMQEIAKEYTEFLKDYVQTEGADIDQTEAAFHEYYVKTHEIEIRAQFDKCVDTIKTKLEIGKKKAKALAYLAIEDISKAE